MKAYFLLRWRVLSRQLVELGWWRPLLLAPVLIAAAGNALVVLSRHPTACWLLPPLLFLLTTSQHRRRADLEFLHLAAPDFRKWVAAEYAFWTVPVMLVLLGFGQFGAAALAIALVPLAAWLPPARARTSTRHRRSVFRSEAFEWVSGFRQTKAGWVWGGLLLTACWWHQYPLAPALALGAWVLTLSALYATPEPWTMLLPALRQPGAWLRRRVGLGLLYFVLTAAPFAWLMGAASAGWGGAVALLWGVAVLIMVVLTRYAFYPHALLVRLTQGAVVAVACLLFGHPVYPVLLLVAFFGLIWKSRRQLAVFRHD
ncbi:hypothetical protein J0X19_13450 [Hymenobacter sp. BT186]|uniref:Uncharacterized protein n=1 Tax=Hymenobacter telluris TaxID=2816474 RepID=A0A939F003_9BACT|nr:hypothetical protein [Hymenobacter telluris]MBO0358958.1 hypothetical protein [Hymenobacter telluris]MBW3374984.1 hypothetical protein [Hymenobacter norwichensis]